MEHLELSYTVVYSVMVIRYDTHIMWEYIFIMITKRLEISRNVSKVIQGNNVVLTFFFFLKCI